MRGEGHYFSKKLYRRKTILENEKKIKLLGVSTKLNVYSFLNLRLMGMVLIFLIFLFTSKIGFVLAPLFTFLYEKGITYFLLDRRIRERQVRLETEALSFFEILTLSLETGRNLNEALNVTVSSSNGELASQFREVLRETSYGKSLTEALEDMQASIPSDTINNIILSLTQANLYGSSIIHSLYSQLDYLREKRKLEIKALISKVPIKISIISVFFFVPLVLIIILAPVLLEYISG